MGKQSRKVTRKAPGVYKATYKDRQGRRRESTNWYVELKDHRGRRLRTPAFKDHRASVELRRRLIQLVELASVGEALGQDLRRWIESQPPKIKDVLARWGLVGAHQAAATKPLSSLMEDFERSLLAAGKTPKTTRECVSRARRVFEGAGARYLTDIRPRDVERFLLEARKQGGADGKGLRAQTVNHLRAAAVHFCRWAVRNKLALENPLESLRKLNVEGDRGRKHAPLDEEQTRKVIDAAERGPSWKKRVPGPTRATIYRLVATTGMRLGDVHGLQVSSFDLDPERPTVRLSAGTSKNRRESVLPVRKELVPELERLLSGRMPSARAFDLQKHWRAAEMLRFDLEAAGIPYKAGEIEFRDFHGLRATFSTSLSRKGVPVRVAQSLMRHSDPRVTMNIYTHLTADDERSAVDALPDFSSPPRTDDAARATGTGDTTWPPAEPPGGHEGASDGTPWRRRRGGSLMQGPTRRAMRLAETGPETPKTDAMGEGRVRQARRARRLAAIRASSPASAWAPCGAFEPLLTLLWPA